MWWFGGEIVGRARGGRATAAAFNDDDDDDDDNGDDVGALITNSAAFHKAFSFHVLLLMHQLQIPGADGASTSEGR